MSEARKAGLHGDVLQKKNTEKKYVYRKAEFEYTKNIMAVDEKLQTVRHSCAHVMAEAILHLFPGTKLAIGPAIDTGFYYDFDFPEDHKITEADFPAIEKEMRRIVSGNHEFVREEISKSDALKMFKDEPYKVDLIERLPEGATISTYQQDDFKDLCRGPHVGSTKEINAQSFKLMKLAGAYWHGDPTQPMLTRVYAACFSKPEDLKKEFGDPSQWNPYKGKEPKQMTENRNDPSQ